MQTKQMGKVCKQRKMSKMGTYTFINRYEAIQAIKQIANDYGIYVKGNSLNEEIHRIDIDEIGLDCDCDICITLNKETNAL